MQSGEVGSDQLPLLEVLEPWLQDIKSSVTQSLHSEPGSPMVFRIVDAAQAKGGSHSFRPLTESLRPRCFLL